MPTLARGRLVNRPRWISTAAVLALALLPLIFPAAAAAHPSLVQSVPLGGLATPTVPGEVRLALTEDVIPRGSSIEVRRIGSAPEGRIVRKAPLKAGPSGLRLALPRLSPAVYEVRWVALGADGHTTAGSFRFGVAGKNGAPPPGAERLSGPGSFATGGRGDEASDSDGAFATVVRWLGLLGAAALIGGALLRRAERRGGHLPSASVREAADRRWRRVAVLALALALFGAAEAVAVLATAGIGDPALALVTDNANGRVALARLLLMALIGLPALRLAAWRRNGGSPPRADALLLAAGVAGVVGYGVDGHVQGGTGSQVLPTLVGGLHGLAAGVWLGGLLALVLLGGDRVRAFKAYAPLALAATAVLAITGTIAALREVDAWYFLRWSDYGRVLVAKIVLAVVAVGLGGWTWRRLRRADGPAAQAPAAGREPGGTLPASSRRTIRLEAGIAVAIVALATVMAGVVPGRGQPFAAQRGNILGGPALATGSSDGDLLRYTVAPATPGRNTVVVEPTGLDEGLPKKAVSGITVRLRCACAEGEVRATLRKGAGDAWSADVDLPASGTWFAYPTVAGRPAPAPVALNVGDTAKGGPKPRTVVQTADLSGRDARRCRAHAQGLALGVGRINAGGGVEGHRKVVLRTYDDGGSPERAADVVRRARQGGAIAVAGPCGAGAGGAIRAAGDLTTIVADPGAPVSGGRHVYRLAADPRAEGVAAGSYVADQGFRLRADAPRRVSVVRVGRVAGDDDVLRGVREGVRSAKVRVDVVEDPSPVAFARATAPDRVASSVITGDRRRLAELLDGLDGRSTAQVVAPGALFDERLVVQSGSTGLQGSIISPSWVRLNSKDGESYSRVIPLLFSGERPSISGLQGYVGGLALAEAFEDGTDASDVEERLDRPRAFTDAITSPWQSTARTRGAPYFTIVQPTFLPENLLTSAFQGGGQVSGRYFTGGSWTPQEGAVYGLRIPGGPDLGAAAVPILPGTRAPGPPGGTPIPGTGGVRAPDGP